MKLEIGTEITWISAAGKLTGKITNITLSPSAAGTITPWIDIKYNGNCSARLCANDGYLKQMKVELVDTNLVERTNIMTGKKYLEPKNTPVFMSPACESYWTM
jgi:hypothetical protein